MTRPRHVTVLFLIVLFATLLMVGRLLWTFIGAIVLALVLVALFQPLQLRLERLFRGRTRPAAAVTTLLIVNGVVVPVALFAVALSRQAYDLYLASRSGPVLAEVVGIFSGNSALAVRARELLSSLGIEPRPGELEQLLGDLAKQLGLKLYQQISGLAANLATVALHFAVMVILVFSLLVFGDRLKAYLMDLSPLPDDEEEALIDRFKMISRAVFLGNGAASLLQGICGGLGFAMFGLGSAVLWGAVIGFLAFLPIVGASVVFLPATGFLLLRGEIGTALVFLAYNGLYVAALEYGLKPKLIGGGSQMNAVLVFIGIVSGLSVFGILGIFYGPLLITMFLALVEIYKGHYRSAPVGAGATPAASADAPTAASTAETRPE